MGGFNMEEKDFEFHDGGDGVEYEVWRHKETGELYRVPIDREEDGPGGEPSIERDFNNAEKI